MLRFRLPVIIFVLVCIISIFGCSNKTGSSPSVASSSNATPVSTGLEDENNSLFKTKTYESYLQPILSENKPNESPFSLDNLYKLIPDICMKEGKYSEGSTIGDINIYSLDWSQRASHSVTYGDSSSILEGEMLIDTKSIEISGIPATYSDNGTVKQCSATLKVFVDSGVLKYYIVIK